MNKINKEIKDLLDKELEYRDHYAELSYDKPDPLLVASRYKDESVVLLCALYGYGKASLIVKFLETLNFDLLNESDETIKKELDSHYYRFQNSEDIISSFIALKRLKQQESLNTIFVEAYKKENNILEGIDRLIKTIQNAYPHNSQGYKFLLSSPLKRDKKGKIKLIGNSPYKRWNMFLRWVIRDDNLDLGLWQGIDKQDLILPLDTHTFNVSKRLGLLTRKTYDLKSAVEITEKLKVFDKKDPIKYDFVLYRIGQEKLI